MRGKVVEGGGWGVGVECWYEEGGLCEEGGEGVRGCGWSRGNTLDPFLGSRLIRQSEIGLVVWGSKF